jgi:hypothetical protein
MSKKQGAVHVVVLGVRHPDACPDARVHPERVLEVLLGVVVAREPGCQQAE